MNAKTTSTVKYIAPEDIQMINGFPAPPSSRARPLKALSALAGLLANKEKTELVFEIASALAGESSTKLFERFVASDYGRRVVADPIRIENILGDREKLRVLPVDSFGRAYLAFMEGEDLSPEALLDAAGVAGFDYESDEVKFDELRRMYAHLGVCHDLLHVLTGYGRDALGEVCIVMVSQKLSGNRGLGVIAWAAAAGIKLQRPSLPIWRTVRQAAAIGEKIAWLPSQDIEALLSRPLADVRDALNVMQPAIYHSINDGEKVALMKPKDGGGRQSVSRAWRKLKSVWTQFRTPREYYATCRASAH